MIFDPSDVQINTFSAGIGAGKVVKVHVLHHPTMMGVRGECSGIDCSQVRLVRSLIEELRKKVEG
jgi:hypothetical protein